MAGLVPAIHVPLSFDAERPKRRRRLEWQCARTTRRDCRDGINAKCDHARMRQSRTGGGPLAHRTASGIRADATDFRIWCSKPSTFRGIVVVALAFFTGEDFFGDESGILADGGF